MRFILLGHQFMFLSSQLLSIFLTILFRRSIKYHLYPIYYLSTRITPNNIFRHYFNLLGHQQQQQKEQHSSSMLLSPFTISVTITITITITI
jgi:hypothetical protein